MTLVDGIGIALVAFAALVGMRRGLIASTLALTGIVVGAFVGARLAPHLLPNGSQSRYTPLAALVGAALLAVLLETVAAVAGSMLRSTLKLSPLRAVDSAGGFMVGALAALSILWVVGAVALQFPGQAELRREAQRSSVLGRLNSIASPAHVLRALARVDPLPTIGGPEGAIRAPSAAVLRRPGVKRAERSVVRVTGTACGLAIEGSGWVVRPGVVVTAAHVVAGEHSIQVDAPGQPPLPAQPAAFDSKNDVAILRVQGLRARPLPLVDAREEALVAIVGYPENGPLKAVPARIGSTVTRLTQDAYGRGPVVRSITMLRGLVRPGNSGGPAVDAAGRVQTTIFAGAPHGTAGGYGVPSDQVRDALSGAESPVSTGGCADD
jgi:uncharacterized membrane protein required for colicin V production